MKNSVRFLVSLVFISLFAVAAGCGGGSSGGSSNTPDTGTQPPPSNPPPSNQAPTVSISGDTSVFEGATVVLTATAVDSDGNIQSYSWSQQSGAAVSIGGASSASASFVAPDVSTNTLLVFQVTVTDNGGLTATDSISITIQPAGSGSAPTARAGLDEVVPVGRSVTLNGSGSTDPDGDTIYFSWELLAKPSGSIATISDSTAAFASLVPDVPGTYQVQLIVTDGANEGVPDVVSIIAGRYLTGIYTAGLTLTKEEGPYYLGGVEVPFGATVVIEPGTELYGDFLAIGGRLAILGTAAEPVLVSGLAIIANEQQDPSWYYDFEIRHAFFRDRAYLTFRGNVGALKMYDSVYLWDGNRGGALRLGSTSADHHLERNILDNKLVRLMAGGPGKVTIKNNVFIHSSEGWWAGIIDMQLAAEPSLFTIEGNSFLVGDGYEGQIWWPCEPPGLVSEGCPVANYSPLDLDLRNNYWGTTDEALIPTWIFDRNERPESGTIYFSPVLTAPDPSTPDPSMYMR